MIPGWEKTIAARFAALAPGGSLHIVDFGQQERLPRWFRLRPAAPGWRNSTSRRVIHCARCWNRNAEREAASLSFETLYRGYAVHAIVRTPGKA